MHSHPRGLLVYAARGVLSVHTDRGTSIVPANRVAWTPAGLLLGLIGMGGCFLGRGIRRRNVEPTAVA